MVGKSFGCVDIDTEHENISISGHITGVDMVYKIVRVRKTEKVLF